MKKNRLLAFKLLGGLSIKLNGEPLSNLASRKAEALLVYLACERQEHSRESLATFLWDDRPLSRSLGNLSVLLTSLRKEVEPFVHLGRNALSFNLESNYFLDSQVFEEKINQARKRQSGQPLRTAAAQLTQALELYQGSFLAGFHIREARDFEEWVLLEQERLQRLAIDGLADLVDFHLLRNQTQEGIAQAARQLALDPLRESAHRQMMQLLMLDGQRNAALAQFETCRQILEDELGVEPAEATTELYEQIRAGDWANNLETMGAGSGQRVPVPISITPTPTLSSLHNLPIQTTTFIGREQELSQITQRLEEPACRLLTLVGHGGIGKTRLALETAKRQVGRFLHGVWFIELAGLSSGEGLVPAIADTLGLAYSDRAGLEDELLAYLRQKEMLLILDNFEQLLEEDEAPSLVQKILRQAFNVILLVTSRERLSLSAEWLVSISGLPYPVKVDDQEIASFAAVQLFAQRAQQVEGEFEVETGPLEAVQRICRLVEGMPLALELAATWLRVHNCEQIANRIETDIGFLSTRLRDVPTRHRSLQAVFDHSWQLMNTAEQTMLQRLAIFKGGFTSEAALQVAEANPETLAALVDKSLVRKRQTEQRGVRYDIHEILRQFAAVRLAKSPTDEKETRDRHARYYAQFCGTQEAFLKGDRVVETLRLMAEEMDNLQAAWQWTYHREESPALDWMAQMVEGFMVFFEMRGRFREGLHFSEEATVAVAAATSDTEGVVLGRLLAWQGWFHFRLSNYEQGQAMAEKGLAITQAEGAWQYTAYPLLFLGAAAFGFGKLEQARDYFLQSLDIYRRLDDKWGISGTLSNLGQVSTAMGDLEAAESYLLECLAVTDANNIPFLRCAGLQQAGRLYTMVGNYETARSSMEEALAVSRAIGDKHSEAMTLLNLGKMNDQLGNEEVALRYLQESQAVFAEIGDRFNECWALVHLGDIAYKQESLQRAHQIWRIVLETGREIQAPTVILAAVAGIARLLGLGDDVELALALLAFVKNHPEAEHQTREGATSHFEAMAEDVAVEKVEAAESLAAGWDMENAIANLYVGA
ncbi:MAG: BTAD domain-containing putative transcriptional regulator [Candidatus Promineifilaceae bacterium]